MGWFDDDDDDDDDDEVKRPKISAYSNNNDNDNNNSGEEEDPLDAYMKSLAATKEETRKPRSARLDVDNEEEATSHWEARESHEEPPPPEEDPNEAALAMQATFHKASDGQKQESRQINIQLEKVQHSSIGYSDFKKNFMHGAKSTQQGHEWRREHHIVCHPPIDPIWEFAELRDVLPAEILEWNAIKGMTQPTLVQSQTLGVALTGKDAIITASTGSGKTLAYLWPLATHLIENKKKCRALVLVPTRELAMQVEKVAKSLLTKLPFKALAITGGNLGRYQLSQELVKTQPHLIVATPGRLLDVLSAQQKSKQDWLLKEISFLVLDEADKMLQLGFAPQVTQVLENLRPDRQSLLTSATLHPKLEQHCREWMNSPSRISIGRTGRSSEHVEQHVMCLPTLEAKQEFMKESLPTFCDVGRTLVFCATRDGCEALAQVLHRTVPLQTLHGDKHPSDRKAALKAFSKGQIMLLIATDVAGRGLDIPQVRTVINYDPAKNWDTHVHRIGRAGRLSAGEQHSGTAYTLLLPSNTDFASVVVQAYEREQRPIPDDLRNLAFRSRRSGGGGGDRPKSSKGGLGFSEAPPTKKSRWS
jgi:ATP-dependent RNA helicase DDX42